MKREPRIKPDEIGVGWLAREYPSVEQAARQSQWFGALRFLWNRLLAADLESLTATGKRLTHAQRCSRMMALKNDPAFPWLKDLPAHACIDTVQRLTGAWSRMFEMRVRAKAEGWSKKKRRQLCGRPVVKKKFKREAGIYCVNQATTIDGKKGVAIVPKLGRITIRGGDVPKGRLLSARITRDGDRWMFAAQFAVKRPEPLATTDTMIGVDLGVGQTRMLVTAFDGKDFAETPTPCRLRKNLRRMRKAQRMVARRLDKKSKRRARALRFVTALHRKIREQRRDVAHKISHRLTTKADVIKVETLNVKGMTQNRHLALSVADAGMANLLRMIAYKADWRGRRVVKLDQWFPSSQLCNECGWRDVGMRDLNRETFICEECGIVEGRDRNAAKNAYWYGEDRQASLWNEGSGRGPGVSRRATGAVRAEASSFVANVI
jgi:putative transposase